MSEFDIMSATWRREPDVSNMGNGTTCCTDGRTIYFAGGNQIQSFDTYTERWGRDIYSISGYAALPSAYYEGYLYVQPQNPTFTDSYKINLTDHTMKTFRISNIGPAPMVAVGTKIYSLGGVVYKNVVSMIDTETDMVTEVAPLPEVLKNPYAAAVGENIYVFGTSTQKVYVYNTLTDIWTNGPEMPVLFNMGAACSFGNKIYLVGAVNQTPSYSVTCVLYVYDVENGTYTEGPKLEIGAHWLYMPYNCAVARGRLYVAGGITKSGDIRVFNMMSMQVADDPGPVDPEEPGEPGAEGRLARLGITLPARKTVQASVSSYLEDNALYTFSTENPEVASVDASGVVQGVAPGATCLKAEKKEDGAMESMPVRVTDSANPDPGPDEPGELKTGDYFFYARPNGKGELSLGARRIAEAEKLP